MKKKTRTLGRDAFSREEIHGPACNALLRFFDRSNFFRRMDFERLTWITVASLLFIGVLGFSWFFFFNGNLIDPGSMLAFGSSAGLYQF